MCVWQHATNKKCDIALLFFAFYSKPNYDTAAVAVSCARFLSHINVRATAAFLASNSFSRPLLPQLVGYNYEYTHTHIHCRPRPVGFAPSGMQYNHKARERKRSPATMQLYECDKHSPRRSEFTKRRLSTKISFLR